MNTIATIKADIRNRILTNGTVMARVPDNTMTQMNEIMAEMREVTGYDNLVFTQEDLDWAADFAKNFKNTSIGTKVVDGYLVPEDPTRVAEALVAIREDLKEAPAGMLIPVVLVNEVLNEERCYAL